MTYHFNGGAGDGLPAKAEVLPTKIRRTVVTTTYEDGTIREIQLNGHHAFQVDRKTDEPEVQSFWGNAKPLRSATGSVRVVAESFDLESVKETIFLTADHVAAIEATQHERAVRAKLLQVKFGVNDLVKLPSRFNLEGTPNRKQDSFWRVKAHELTNGRYWSYVLVDRSGKRERKIGVNSAPALKLEKVDRWPLRKGDFVLLRPNPNVTPSGPWKIIDAAFEGPELDGKRTVWRHLENRYGDHTTALESQLEVVEVEVLKPTPTWSVL